MQIAINAYDPTRTTTLRNMFANDMQRRFNELIQVIKQGIIKNDAFGLQTNQMTTPLPNEFDFPRSQDKISSFNNWLKRQVNLGILETASSNQLGAGIENAWTNVYIRDSYKRGVIRARAELKNKGFTVPSISETGGVTIALQTPIHVDRLGLLYTRTYSDLKGVTDTMDGHISRVLAQGIADGDNPNLLARKIVSVIDDTGAGELGVTDTLGRFIPAKRRAKMIARTEIIRAHAEATLQEYKNWGVEGVEIMAEFVTAGDDRVCPECSSLTGNKYHINEASGIIPVHISCRCSWIPVKIK